jgi:hypothetical protein
LCSTFDNKPAKFYLIKKFQFIMNWWKFENFAFSEYTRQQFGRFPETLALQNRLCFYNYWFDQAKTSDII